MNNPVDIFRALRPNQWTKNLVVLAAFCFAFGDKTHSLPVLSLCRSLAACGLFCLASSGIYIINDIADLSVDKLHPAKRFRPIAAGRVSIGLASGLSGLLLVIAVGASFWLAPLFGGVVTAYVVMQLIYTYWLKHIALVDVFIIALGFVLRAAGGGLAIPVMISPWLLICAFLLALFLALCKRRHEKLFLADGGDGHRPSLGNYDQSLLDQLIAIVSAATIVSYSVYTLSAETIRRFGTSMLSITIPFVIFGIFRYLDLVYRKEGGGRPEKTLLTDRVLILDVILYGVCVLGIFLFARQGHQSL